MKEIQVWVARLYAGNISHDILFLREFYNSHTDEQVYLHLLRIIFFFSLPFVHVLHLWDTI